MEDSMVSSSADSSGHLPYSSVSSSQGEPSIQECICVPLFKDGVSIDGKSDVTEHSVLGEGSYGQVFNATVRTETGEEIYGAMKRAVHGMSCSLCKELRILMPLQGHRNILEVLAWASDGQRATAMLTKRYPFRLRDAVSWYKMQFLRGSDAELQPLVPLRLLWPLILSLAHAFMFLQKHSIVHRDIKPENIMLDDDGQPVIIDFGSAIHGYHGEVMTLPVGTPSYLAPEVASCVSKPVEVDPSMDAYSFAMVIAEATIGFPPRKIRELPPTSAEEQAVEDFMPYDDELRWLVSATLNVDPEQRPDIGTWVKEATAACARLKCGGRSATRPLLQAAASWLAEQDPEVAPASASAGRTACSSSHVSIAAPGEAASDAHAAASSAQPSPDAACDTLPVSDVSLDTSFGAGRLEPASPAMLLASWACDEAAERVDTADAVAATDTSLCSSVNPGAAPPVGACEPIPSPAAMMFTYGPPQALAADDATHSGDARADDEASAGEELAVDPLPRRLSSVAAPRVSFVDLGGDLATHSRTPRGGSPSPVPSALGRTPGSAGTLNSPWHYTETPCASPILMSPRPADAGAATAEECGLVGFGPKIGATERDAAVPPPVAAESDEAIGDYGAVIFELREAVAGDYGSDNTGMNDGAAEGVCPLVLGMTGVAPQAYAGDGIDEGQGEVTVLGKMCVRVCDVGTQTEGELRGVPRWCGWMVAAGAVGLVAAKVVLGRR